MNTDLITYRLLNIRVLSRIPTAAGEWNRGETEPKPGRNRIEQHTARNHGPLLTTYIPMKGAMLLIIGKEARNETSGLVQVH